MLRSQSVCAINKTSIHIISYSSIKYFVFITDLAYNYLIVLLSQILN